MNKSTMYNLFWLCVWAIMGIACLTGAIMGNKIHYLFTAGCGYFVYLTLTDNEYGESVKAYFTRKFTRKFKESK